MATGLSLFENARQKKALTTPMRRFPINPHRMIFYAKQKGIYVADTLNRFMCYYAISSFNSFLYL